MLITCLVFSALLVSTLGERISATPDVSWRGSPSSSSSNLGRDNSFNSGSSFSSGSRFSGDSNSNSGSNFGGSNSDRFPITGSGSGSRVDSSRVSGSGSSNSRNSGTGSRDVWDTNTDFNSGSRTTVDPNRGNYVRIIASIVSFNNSKSLTSTGSSCSTFGKCDPLVFAYLDTERPNAVWPGARDTKFWPQVFAAKKADSFNINVDNITKDFCGQTYKEANLRVHIEDKKTLLSNAIINEFDCPVNRFPQDSLITATWSPVTACLPRFQADKMALFFKYKVFYVSKVSCGVDSSSTTTTPKSSFFG